jgi:tetratricopeptide (TPR) repeat protein
MTEQALLQAADSDILAFLAQLPNDEIGLYTHALAILWQVHPDPDIQAIAKTVLDKFDNASQLEQQEKALRIFDSIISYPPWTGDHKALQQQNYALFEAQKAPYEGLLVNTPLFLERYLDLGRRLYKMFELLPEAKACFENILVLLPEQPEALYALGRLVEQEGAYQDAMAYYERCIQQQPEHVYARLQLGLLLVEQEQAYEKAIQHYQVVLEVEPFMAETHVRMAEAHRAAGDLSRAKQFLDIALDINPYQEEALNALGIIQWKDEGKIDAAIATFEKGVDHKVHGDSSLLLASLGRLHQEQLGDFNKARLYYEKSLAANMQQPEIFQQLMNLLEDNYQDYGAMTQYYTDYLAKATATPAIHTDYAAFSIKYLHDYETAQQQLEHALALEEDYPPAVALSLQVNQQLSINGMDDDDLLFEDDFDDEDEDEDEDDDFSGGGAAGDN